MTLYWNHSWLEGKMRLKAALPVAGRSYRPLKEADFKALKDGAERTWRETDVGQVNSSPSSSPVRNDPDCLMNAVRRRGNSN